MPPSRIDINEERLPFWRREAVVGNEGETAGFSASASSEGADVSGNNSMDFWLRHASGLSECGSIAVELKKGQTAATRWLLQRAAMP